MKLVDYSSKQNTIKIKEIILNYEQFLPSVFALYLYNYIRKENGVKYGLGFYHDKLNYNKTWIDSEPCSSIVRLRNKNQCVYCDVDLKVKYGVGDHIVGKKLNSALWLVPCCIICNSSKGNRDLLYWWCIMKKRNIMSLKKDVFATYVRAKNKLLKLEGKLFDKPNDYHIEILKQFEGVE